MTIADGALTGTAQQRVIELTGSISGSRVVTFPLLTENFYFIKNSTSGAQTVQLKAVSGSGATVTFATGNKGWKVIYLDGVATNTGVYEIEIDTTATPAGSDTQVQFNNSGAFGASANLTWDDANLLIDAEGEMFLCSHAELELNKPYNWYICFNHIDDSKRIDREKLAVVYERNRQTNVWTKSFKPFIKRRVCILEDFKKQI